jgi:ParB family chromosome partitioning protein
MQQAMAVLTSHETAEWYTPPKYVELARAVLGEIDLDPASDALPQTWIKAIRYYARGYDGLSRFWFGNIWLNPPYGKTGGKSNQAVWSAKMVDEYENGRITEGILLVNSTHGYKWYEELWTRYPVCLVRERIRFFKPDGTEGGQAKRGQTFVYFGSNVERFAEVFSSIGRIIL